MQVLMTLKPRKLSTSNFNNLFTLSSSYLHSSSSPPASSLPSPTSVSTYSTATNLFTAPWSTVQRRGVKVPASDIKVGNTIGKEGRIFEVLKVEHSPEGIGKAITRVELRDLIQGNKVIQRLGSGDDFERADVQGKIFMYMCTDHDGTVVLMDPDTLDQVEVSKDLFGKNFAYIKDEMKVKVKFYDGIPLSASVPKHVICTVKEVIAATTRHKKVVLENGLTVEVPPHIVAGDAIVVYTEDDSYIERAKARVS